MHSQREPGTPPAPDEARTFDLNGCARCDGEGHPGLTFEPLTHPLTIGGVVLSHWAPCPTNGEPILLTFDG